MQWPAAGLGKLDSRKEWSGEEHEVHPRWQRSILGSLLKRASHLHHGARIQLVTVTHSPLVLASAEPSFDSEQDAWFDLDLHRTKTGEQVRLEKRHFVRHGDVSNWLTSEAFDLKESSKMCSIPS